MKESDGNHQPSELRWSLSINYYKALLLVYVEVHKYPGELKFKTKDGILTELVNFRNYKNKLTCKARDVMWL